MLPQYAPYFPAVHMGAYVEPMCGSAALALEWSHRWQGSVHLSDSNMELMQTFQLLKVDAQHVCDVLSTYVDYYNSQCDQDRQFHFYEWVRSELNRRPAGAKIVTHTHAAQFIFLNRTGFNGLYRVNAKGVYNVPFGKIHRLPNGLIGAVNKVGADLALDRYHVHQAKDFTWVDEVDWPEGTIFYFDPPFDGAFNGYTSGGFSDADQYRLRNLAEDLIARGTTVYVANSDTPFIRGLYNGHEFEIIGLQGRRSISCKGETRGWVPELLIRG